MERGLRYGIGAPDILQSGITGYVQGRELKRKFDAQDALNELANIDNPTANDINNAMMKAPEMAKIIQASYDNLKDEQRSNQLRSVGQLYSVLKNDDIESAREMLESRKQAALNSGLEDEAKLIDIQLRQLDMSPQQVKNMSEIGLRSILGAKKFDELYGDGTDEEEQLDIEKKRLEVKEKAQKVKGMEVEQKKDVSDAISNVNYAKDILNMILGDEKTLRRATGKSAILASIPGSKARSMKGRIEQLQNTLAKANLGSLKGALSDKDILFLKNIESNLDRYQDEDAFISELKRIGRKLNVDLSKIKRDYGVEESEDIELTVPSTTVQVDDGDPLGLGI